MLQRVLYTNDEGDWAGGPRSIIRDEYSIRFLSDDVNIALLSLNSWRWKIQKLMKNERKRTLCFHLVSLICFIQYSSTRLNFPPSSSSSLFCLSCGCLVCCLIQPFAWVKEQKNMYNCLWQFYEKNVGIFYVDSSSRIYIKIYKKNWKKTKHKVIYFEILMLQKYKIMSIVKIQKDFCLLVFFKYFQNVGFCERDFYFIFWINLL